MAIKKRSKKTSKRSTKKSPKKSTGSKRTTSKKRSTAKKQKTEEVVPELAKRLERFLADANATYSAVGHRTVYTAYDTAQTLKRSISDVAKTLVVMADRDVIIAVIPAHRHLDTSALKKLINKDREAADMPRVKKLKLTTERTIDSKLYGQPGAISPFGGLQKVRTYVDTMLTKPRELVVNGGSFTISLLMTPKEFMRVADAVMGVISKPKPKR